MRRPAISAELKDRLIAVGLWAAAAFCFVSVISYHPFDLDWETSAPNHPTQNAAGIVGAYLAYLALKGVGLAAYSLPLLLVAWGWWVFQGHRPHRLALPLLGTGLFLLAASTLLAMVPLTPTVKVQSGGVVGVLASEFLTKYFGGIGSTLIAACLTVLTALLATEAMILSAVAASTQRLVGFGQALWASWQRPRVRDTRTAYPQEAPAQPALRPAAKPTPPLKPRVTIEPSGAAAPKFRRSTPPAPKQVGAYQLPTLDLLTQPPPVSERRIKEDLEANGRVLEETLREFGIEARVVAIDRGPTITCYELQPAPGMKVSRIASLSDDIALVMKAQSVRIVAPIPGKSAVGVEVPNGTISNVFLREVLESREYQEGSKQSKLALALGKDVSGVPLGCNLQECPHLLIAGTTGSGKTVCLNSILMGLLFNATPDEVKLLLVDPKMVELSPYNDIPHLIAPVMTDAKKSAHALHWVVNEMEGRYRLFAKRGVRNIDMFNASVDAGTTGSAGDTPEDEPFDSAPPSAGPRSGRMLSGVEAEPEGRLPYIVVVIDELADLMLIASQEVEEAITRLSQLSRAVGIHIILATQRPSVDVITGVIKANFPARISFQVASKVDSRTVLDMNGADKLLGKGDMLFLSPGSSKPFRAQGAYVSDQEIERVVSFLKVQREPDYDEELLKAQEKSSTGVRGERDEMYDDARHLVLETGQASTSMIQRRLRLGYTRAARLLDMMEEEGVVGPFRGSKPREILVDREAYLRSTVESSSAGGAKEGA